MIKLRRVPKHKRSQSGRAGRFLLHNFFRVECCSEKITEALEPPLHPLFRLPLGRPASFLAAWPSCGMNSPRSPHYTLGSEKKLKSISPLIVTQNMQTRSQTKIQASRPVASPRWPENLSTYAKRMETEENWRAYIEEVCLCIEDEGADQDILTIQEFAACRDFLHGNL